MGCQGKIPGSLPVDAPERRRLPLLLRRAWFSLNQAFRRRIAHLGVTPDHFTVLRTLHEANGRPVTQQQLVRLISSDANTITALVRRMERAGLIERAPHQEDRRAICLRLRDGGRKKYRAARHIAVTLQAEVLAAVPPRQRERFLASLETIASACQQAGEGSARDRERKMPRFD